MGRLRFLDENGQLQEFELLDERLTIGRGEECGLTLEGEMISREHAQLIREPDGKWRLKDLGSRNRTQVNGQAVGEILLGVGDIIKIGEHVLEYCEEKTRATTVIREFLINDRKDPPGSEWIKVREPLTVTLGPLGKISAMVEHSGVMARVEQLADLALSRLLIDLRADRGFIALKGDEAKGMELLSVRGLSRRGPAGGPAGISQSFVYSSLLQHVAGRYPGEARADEELPENYARTAVTAPLVNDGKEMGVIYLDRPRSRRPFPLTAVHHLLAAGAVLGSALVRAQRRLSSMHGQISGAHLGVLRRLQAEQFVLPSGGELFEAATRLVQGAERCGDLQETILLDDNRIVMVMTDAGGTGVSGLMQSMAIYAGIRVALEGQDDTVNLGAALQMVNRTLCGRSSRQLIACAAVLIDLTAGRLAYLNAGLPAPLLLVGPQRLVTLDKAAPLLGVEEGVTYDPTFVDLSSRFRVILHTDGLTEALSPTGESFGEERLHEALLLPEAFDTPEQLLDQIVEAVESHVGKGASEDDALVLAVAHG